MADINSLLIRKTGATAKKDIKTDFGIVVIEEPFLEPREIKDLGSRDWPDEHGVDVYNAPEVLFKEYDADFKLGCKATAAKTCHEQFRAFLDYLTHGGILHDIYCPWNKSGVSGAAYKSSGDFQSANAGGESFLTWKTTFRITKPNDPVSEF